MKQSTNTLKSQKSGIDEKFNGFTAIMLIALILIFVVAQLYFFVSSMIQDQ